MRMKRSSVKEIPDLERDASLVDPQALRSKVVGLEQYNRHENENAHGQNRGPFGQNEEQFVGLLVFGVVH